MQDGTIPAGLCQCGCGRATSSATRTAGAQRKGQPNRFVRGHHASPRLGVPPIAVRWESRDCGYETPCHVWLLALTRRGYGHERHNGAPTPAHRAAWERANGPIPDGLWVLHHCDNPPCVNPEHLFLGTHQDNMDDMMAKGRYRKGKILRGSSHHQAKLTEADVVAIRRSSERQGMIARRYKVSRATISLIRLRKTWRHV